MRVRLLRSNERAKFIGLTYPSYREPVLRFAETEVITVGGDLDGIPVGFGFAVPHPNAYEVGSVHVSFDDPFGTLREPLLRAMMAEADRRGWGIGVFHPTFDSDDRSITALARKCGWVGPGIRQISARTTIDKMLSLWFVRLGVLRDGYEVVPWRDITPAIHHGLEQASAELDGSVKQDLCPLKYESRADLDISFVLLRDGRPIGWHLPERLDEATYRWTCSAVAPGHWSMAAVIQLWVPALHAQQKTGVPGLIWGVPVIHANMVRFVFRRLRPGLDSIMIGASFQAAPQGCANKVFTANAPV
jgi:hypothetical protein